MIDTIEVRGVEEPMHRPFAHAGKRRTRTASVLVALGAAGRRGWGEGAPRPYVTGETVRTAVDALGGVEAGRLDDLVDVGDFTGAIRTLARLDLVGLTGGRAAAAALEIALFDLVCRLHDRDGLSALHAVPETAALVGPVASPVPVSAVLDLDDTPERIPRPDARSGAAVRHVKLKADQDVEGCVRRVAAVRERLGPRPGISVDVNGAWTAAQAVDAARRLRRYDVAWLEEPVAARDWAAMREIRETTGVAVMLDESCTGIADLRVAAGLGAADHVNARISKCGGIFPTLGLVAAAREQGLGAQLGVHVGEVGPLWAAARLVSCTVAGLVAVEAGRQDEWFATPLTEPPYSVDRRNYVAPPLDGPGIGVVPGAALRNLYPSTPESVGRER